MLSAAIIGAGRIGKIRADVVQRNGAESLPSQTLISRGLANWCEAQPRKPQPIGPER